MPVPLAIAAAYGLAKGLYGAISGNQRKQRNKGIISKAYKTGRERLDLTQGDERQSITERAGQRGLAQGGGVRASGPVRPVGEVVNPQTSGSILSGVTRGVNALKNGGAGNVVRPVSVSGAYDLGSQQQADLAREQQLGQTELANQRDAALATNNAEYMQTLVNSAGDAVESGMSLYGAGGPSTPSVKDSFTSGIHGTPAPDSPYPGAWGGIDPVYPFQRGTGAPASNRDFNVFQGTDRRNV